MNEWNIKLKIGLLVVSVMTKHQDTFLYLSGALTAEAVQEVLVGGGGGAVAGGAASWLDAHVVAGVVSALLLATALIICVCVAVRRRRYDGYR